MDIVGYNNVGVSNTLTAGTISDGTATLTGGVFTGSVIGNISGTAASVTDAAQPAITSLGTLSSLDIGNVNFDVNAAPADLVIESPSGAQIAFLPSTIALNGVNITNAGVVTGVDHIFSNTFTDGFATITGGVYTGDVLGNVTGNVNGNLTGDVLTSAQPNITSLGTLSGLTLSGTMVHSFSSANASDAGLTIADGITTYIINSGTETVNFNLTGPNGVAGQILMVRNNTGQNTLGLVVSLNGGAIFIHDGSSWVKVAETN